MGNIEAHQLELAIGINEVSAAGANHDKQLEAGVPADGSDQACAWSNAPFQQVRTEFNANGAA